MSETHSSTPTTHTGSDGATFQSKEIPIQNAMGITYRDYVNTVVPLKIPSVDVTLHHGIPNLQAVILTIISLVSLPAYGYYEYLLKNVPKMHEFSLLHLLTIGSGITDIHHPYVSKKNLNFYGPLNLSQISLSAFRTQMDRYNLAGLAFDKIWAYYTSAVEALHNTELIRLYIDIRALDWNNPQTTSLLRTLFSGLLDAAIATPGAYCFEVTLKVTGDREGNLHAMLRPPVSNTPLGGQNQTDLKMHMWQYKSDTSTITQETSSFPSVPVDHEFVRVRSRLFVKMVIG